MTVTVTDLFAGAGGSSTGMADIPGVEVRMAANHWRVAIDIHNRNHPNTDHAAVDLHQEDPAYFPRTDVLWASPECTKWSQANGKQLPAIEEGLFEDPDSDDAATRSRLLMFDVLRFAEHHRYAAMIVENVVDIATQPKYRLAWHVWRQQLTALGYRFRVVSLNSMHAQTYGPPAPQSRDRIYIVCWRADVPAPDVDRVLRPQAWCSRCEAMVEGQQAWKNGKTVGRYRQTYVYVHATCGTVVEPGWLPAAAAIDWSIPGERIGDRLKPKTRARIAAGIARYWGRPIHLEAAGQTYDAADPHHPAHGDPNAYYRAWPVDEQLRALHTTASKALAVPVEGRDGKEARTLAGPMRTQTTRAETGLVTDGAFMLDRRFEYRVRDLADPLSTVTANDTSKALLREPFVAELRGGGSDARAVTDPAATFCASGNHHALVMDNNHANRCREAVEPLPTQTTATTKALLTPYYGNADHARPADDPLGTLTTRDRYALVHRMNGGGAEMSTPATEYMRTLTTKGHQALIQPAGPTGKPRVTPADLVAAAELVPECLFRMLRPHEVAAGMAFPGTYVWQPYDDAIRVSNRDLVKAAGNAVTPPAARDLIACVAAALTGEWAAVA